MLLRSVLYAVTAIAVASSACASDVDRSLELLAELHNPDPLIATQSFLEILDSPELLSTSLPALLALVDAEATNVSVAHLYGDFMRRGEPERYSPKKAIVMFYFIAYAIYNEPNEALWAVNVQEFRRFIENKRASSYQARNQEVLLNTLFLCVFSFSQNVEARQHKETYATIKTIIDSHERLHPRYSALYLLPLAAYLLPDSRDEIMSQLNALILKYNVEDGHDISFTLVRILRDSSPLSRKTAALLNTKSYIELLESDYLDYAFDILIQRLNDSQQRNELVIRLISELGYVRSLGLSYIPEPFPRDAPEGDVELIDAIIERYGADLEGGIRKHERAYSALKKLIDSRPVQSEPSPNSVSEPVALEYEAYGQERVIGMLISELDCADLVDVVNLVDVKDARESNSLFSSLLRDLVELSGLNANAATTISAALKRKLDSLAHVDGSSLRVTNAVYVDRMRSELISALENTEQEVHRFSAAKNLQKAAPPERLGGKYLAKWSRRTTPSTIVPDRTMAPTTLASVLGISETNSHVEPVEDPGTTSETKSRNDIVYAAIWITGLTSLLLASIYLIVRSARR